MERQPYEPGGTATGDDNPDPNNNGSAGANNAPDLNVIVGAPDLTSLIKRRQTVRSKEYRDKTAAVFKALAIGAIQSGDLPDAATLLWHGPGAATAIGDLCDTNERVAQVVDMITSPTNPWSAFAVSMLPLAAQLMRNHEKQLEDLPSKFNMSRQARMQRKMAKSEQPKSEPRFMLRVGRRRIPIRFNAKIPAFKRFLGGVKSQTYEPEAIAQHVFTQPDVLKALEKIGITFRNANDT